MKRMRPAIAPALALAAAALLLAGCATDPTLPPRPEGTALEQAVLQLHHNEWAWAMSVYPEAAFPAVEFQQILTEERWEDRVRACLADLGFAEVTVSEEAQWWAYEYAQQGPNDAEVFGEVRFDNLRLRCPEHPDGWHDR